MTDTAKQASKSETEQLRRQLEQLAGSESAGVQSEILANAEALSLKQENDILREEVERLRSVEMKYRRELWLNHGHDGLYGDDGEMQCSQCQYSDYRRAQLEDVEAMATKARFIRLGTELREGQK